MITLNHKVWGRFSCSRSCASTRACTGPCVVCAHVNEGVLRCQRARGLLHPGGRTGPKLHPRPVSQSLLPHPCAVMGCLRGWWFPWQPAAFCAPRVMRAVCWRLRGEERRGGRRGGGGGVQSDIGWRREQRERGKQLPAIIQSASVFSFPIVVFNQHRTLIKTATRAKWSPPFAYTCCVKSELTPERQFTLTWSC